MAIRHSSRKHPPARHAIAAHNGAQSPAAPSSPSEDLALQCLNRLGDQLRLALCTSTTTSIALRGQAAKRDQDFAALLDRCCAMPLFDVLEDIEAVLQEIARRNPSAVPTAAEPTPET